MPQVAQPLNDDPEHGSDAENSIMELTSDDEEAPAIIVLIAGCLRSPAWQEMGTKEPDEAAQK